MTFEDDVRCAFDISEMADASGSEQAARLDSTVTTRLKGEEGYLYPSQGQLVEAVNVRVVQTGDRVEIYQYESPVKLHLKPKRKVRQNKLHTVRDQEYRSRRAHRANNALRRLANGNFSRAGKFLTLTFNNDQQFDINDIKQCNRHYRVFIKKLQLKFPGLKYLTVLEFQKRGAVHYHILNDLPFINKEDIATLWGHGFVDVREIKHPEAVGGYIAKYMAKNSLDPRFSENRSYFVSKTLLRPITIYGFKAAPIIQEIKQKQLKSVFSNQYYSAYHKQVKYSEYNLNYISPLEEKKT